MSICICRSTIRRGGRTNILLRLYANLHSARRHRLTTTLFQISEYFIKFDIFFLCLCHLIIVIKGPSFVMDWFMSSSSFHVPELVIQLERKQSNMLAGFHQNVDNNEWRLWVLTKLYSLNLFDEQKLFFIASCEMLTIRDDELFTFFISLTMSIIIIVRSTQIELFIT